MARSIDRDELRELVEGGGQLVDVLPRQSYDHAHLPGALSIPLKQFGPRSLAQLDRRRPVIVYCSGYL